MKPKHIIYLLVLFLSLNCFGQKLRQEFPSQHSNHILTLKGWLIFSCGDVLIISSDKINPTNNNFFLWDHFTGYKVTEFYDVYRYYNLSTVKEVYNATYNARYKIRICPVLFNFNYDRDYIYTPDTLNLELMNRNNKIRLKYVNYLDHEDLSISPFNPKDSVRLGAPVDPALQRPFCGY